VQIHATLGSLQLLSLQYLVGLAVAPPQYVHDCYASLILSVYLLDSCTPININALSNVDYQPRSVCTMLGCWHRVQEQMLCA